jgi:lactate dehydrogenase-like 2-hydroxyacid dehydrogenase
MPGAARVPTLAEGLARADIVSLHVDLNPSTFHLLDAATIALMKPSAIVLNTFGLDEAAARRALADAEDSTGLTADDPVRFGPAGILDAVAGAVTPKGASKE